MSHRPTHKQNLDSFWLLKTNSFSEDGAVLGGAINLLSVLSALSGWLIWSDFDVTFGWCSVIHLSIDGQTGLIGALPVMDLNLLPYVSKTRIHLHLDVHQSVCIRTNLCLHSEVKSGGFPQFFSELNWYPEFFPPSYSSVFVFQSGFKSLFDMS